MSKLNDFASLVKKAAEDKKIKEEEEKQRKLKKVAPMLDDFAKLIQKAKEEPQPKVIEAPTIDLKPTKLPTPSEPVKIDSSPVPEAPSDTTEVDEDGIDPNILKKLDSKYLRLFNRLQSDFQTLKKTIAQTPVGFGGAGSGEVRILRMDDVDARDIQNNSVLVYDASMKKFVPVLASELGTGTTPTTPTDEEMPYAKRTDFITDNELYKGEAPVGSPDGNPVWRIRKVVIGNDGDVSETWANGNAEYTNRWTDRLTLTYS